MGFTLGFKVLLISIVFTCSLCVDVWSPKYRTGNRTAVIVSGEIRSGNITFSSGRLEAHYEKNYFNNSDPRSPIDTLLEYIIKPLGLYGGVDVFIYIPVQCYLNAPPWNNDPAWYEPYVGDFRVCDIYNRHPIFQNSTGNKVICVSECIVPLLDTFILARDDWRTFSRSNPRAKEPFLQQEYGKYRGNLAAKQFSELTGIKYRYKIRLRHDEAAVETLPNLENLSFYTYKSVSCKEFSKRYIFYSDENFYGFSTQDSFNFGLSEDMDKVLDRYEELLTEPILSTLNINSYWLSEDNLIGTLKNRHGVCLVGHEGIKLTKIRIKNHYKKIISPEVNSIWNLMPSSTAQLKSYRNNTASNRTAVIVASEIRELRESISRESKTAIAMTLNKLIVPFNELGNVDVFIYIPISCPSTAMQYANHVSFHRQACEAYSDHAIFYDHQNDERMRNKVYCQIECATELFNPFIANRDDWSSFKWRSERHIVEQFLQFEFSKYRANQAAKENAIANNVSYRYKALVRYDSELRSELLSFENLLSHESNTSSCYGMKEIYQSTNEANKPLADALFVGKADYMDKLLDRYIDLLTKPIVNITETFWTPEGNLIDSLKSRYNICLSKLFDIKTSHIHIKKERGVKLSTIKNSWSILSPYPLRY